MERLNDDETHLDSGLARRLREEIKRDALVSRHNTEYDDADEPLSMGSATRRSGVQSGSEGLQITPALVEQTKEFLQQSVSPHERTTDEYLSLIGKGSARASPVIHAGRILLLFLVWDRIQKSRRHGYFMSWRDGRGARLEAVSLG